MSADLDRDTGTHVSDAHAGPSAGQPTTTGPVTGTEPAALDVPIDPDVNAWTYPRFAAYERNGVPST